MRSFESVWGSSTGDGDDDIYCDVALPAVDCDGVILQLDPCSNAIGCIIDHPNNGDGLTATSSTTRLGLLNGRGNDGSASNQRSDTLISTHTSLSDITSEQPSGGSDSRGWRTTLAGKLCTGLIAVYRESHLMVQAMLFLGIAGILCSVFVSILLISLPDTMMHRTNASDSLISTGEHLLITQRPSREPSAMPSWTPSSKPSSAPSLMPSSKPSAIPTSAPSSRPSSTPSASPSFAPTSMPSIQPSFSPSERPSPVPSMMPSIFPTAMPSSAPSTGPTSNPSSHPTAAPSSRPTHKPSPLPSGSPTASPSSPPSAQPTAAPTKSFAPSTSPTRAPTSSPTHPPLIFYAMGDSPYKEKEARKLMSQVAGIPDEARFVVHVGDMKKGGLGATCPETAYSEVYNILRTCRSPVFIIPGDNDIADCPNKTQAWAHWTNYFGTLDDNWRHGFNVDRSGNHMENFAFFLDDVLFLGYNMISASRIDIEEAVARSVVTDTYKAFTIAKIKEFRDRMVGLVIFGHAEPKNRHFRPIAKEIKSLKVPTLYLHGNGHEWEYEQNAFDARNAVRVQVDRGGIAAPLRVEFQRDRRKPFQFTRFL